MISSSPRWSADRSLVTRPALGCAPRAAPHRHRSTLGVNVTSCAASTSASTVPGRPRRRARGRPSRVAPTIGANLIMPSFVAIIVGGLGSLLGTLLGGLMIGVASGLAAGRFSLRHRSGDLRDDGAGAAHPPPAVCSAKRGGCIEPAPQPPLRRRRLNPAAAHAVLDGRDRRLYRTGDPHRRHGAGGDVAELSARISPASSPSDTPPILGSAPMARRWRSSISTRERSRQSGSGRRRNDRGDDHRRPRSSSCAASISPW